MLSVRQKYLVGKPLILFIAQQDRQIFSCLINNSQEIEDCVIEIKPRVDTPFPASIRASPVYDSQENLVGWRWLLRDISEAKQAQEQVAKRTVELAKANQQLLSEITEHKRAKSQLLHLAFHDVLTGLPNRALFMNRLEDAVNYSKRHSEYLFAVLFLDLNSSVSLGCDSCGCGMWALTLITANIREFSRVPNLKVENWLEPR
ncbi:PAS domain-containing protein [Nostoc sp. 'Peltigera membranacea cyanobiont' N6]|uniref:PAS domain-containing protein n=1 Tax=Nostoc sp. 'Peltigera membranacea cyanobiont' N6 TaxID=1261031 RepID=UPI00215898BE|nr:diguanylate cyclase [Nostoc sp. 'Peltigera membranacea cyanobiont' N6]